MAIRITGMNSGMDTDAMVKELVKAYETKGQKTKNEQTKAKWKQDIWTDLNKKIKSFSAKVSNMKYSSGYSKKKTTSSDESKVSVVAGDNAIKGTQTVEVKNLAKTAYMTSGKLGYGTEAEGKVTGSTKLSELGLTSGGKITISKNSGEPVTFDVNEDTTIDEFVKMTKKAGVEANFDSNSGRLFIYSSKSGEASDFTISADSDDLMKTLGLYEYSDEEKTELFGDNKIAAGLASAKMIHGEDAIITLNGATFTSDTNTISANGLSITAKGLTEDSAPISITTDADYDAIYDNIKSVIKEYASLINELDKLYNADVAKGYDPLTDEEKQALSDDEVEKWESKIKDSLLRRDENVNSVASAMKNAGLTNYTVNGKKYSLSDFGINTLDYFIAKDNEKNALHVMGDADDENVSGETNKLKAMISSNTEDTVEFFKQYFTSISENLERISKTTTERSFGSFYNDKAMKSDVDKYEKKVADWEEYVTEIEDKYYKQFTRMEKEMAKLNSTQSSLGSYFGM